MGISRLYALNKEERGQLYETMAENFLEDELYVQVFPERSFRKKFLPFYFRQYLSVLMKESYVLADSAEKNGVLVLFDSTMASSFGRYVFSLVRMNILLGLWLIAHGSIKELKALLEHRVMFTSTWTKQFVQNEDHLHLDLLYTRKQRRKEGIASRLLSCVCEEGDERGCSITMETHHPDNLRLYRKFGFTEMMTITQESCDLKEYCLLRKAEKKGEQHVSEA